MKKEVGDKNFDIWLLGDSNPKNWESILDTPFDPRHPIRHNIWTSILDVIQDRVYRESRRRINSGCVYIRNAIEDPDDKPKGNELKWNQETEHKLGEFRSLLQEYHPAIVFSFGAFSYEFARRSIYREPIWKFGYWGARRLGEEFRSNIPGFSPDAINLLPLLHRTISGGKYIESHEYYCNQPGANYFDYVGNQIADILLRYPDKLKVWIE